MALGGFLVKFQFESEKKKEISERCAEVTFSFDDWAYTMNNKPTRDLPKKIKRIILEVEVE